MPTKPPPRLPPGFREIWLALREADDLASRAELSRRLGVSTHTLQRILVNGDVPDFSKRHSTRLARSWARSLTRLAYGLGRDPRRWIEKVGISWDEGVRAASESTLRQLRRSGPFDGSVTGAKSGPLERIRAETARGRPDPVEVGLVDLRPFVDPLPDGRDCFFEAYAGRLVGAVDPRWGIRTRRAAAADLVDALTDDDSSLHLAVGLFETAHLRGRGLEFLPLPGWQLGFSAVAVSGGGAPTRRPVWSELSSPRAGDRWRWLVSECDPAWSLVRSQWGVRSERVMSRRRAAPEELGEDLLREARRTSDPVVLVADEETCRRVLGDLERRVGFAREFSAVGIAPPAEERPRFQLAVAVRAEAAPWAELLRYAGREDLFGASRAVTGRLYADLLTTGARALSTFGGPFSGELPTNFRPEPFAEADAEFQRTLCRRLVASLRAAPAAAAPEPGRSGEETPEEVWEDVVRRARALLPREWRTTLDEVAWRARREELAAAPGELRPFHSYCQSCSGSLREYPGPSPRYCRYCSDEEGRLRPRDEVLQLIAEWMQAWQGGITRDEARDRASRYMSAMPAWSGE